MPVGSFQWGGGLSGGLNPDNRAGGSLTGPGPASQPSNTWGPPISPSFQSPTNQPLNPNIGKWAMDSARTVSNQLAQQAVGPSNSLAGARSILDTFYGPQSQLLNDTLARQQAQLGQVGVQADYSSDLLRRDADLSQRGLDLDKKAVGLDSKTLAIDKALTSGQLANLDRLVGILGKQYGLEGESYATILNQLGIDEAKLKDMAKRQTFDLRSNLTARGAFNTEANKRGTGRINRDLIYGLGGINNQRRSADIQHRGNVLGLDEKGIGLDNQRLGLNARLANIGVDSEKLGLALERIGLSEEGLANQLQDGLHQIGLDAQISIDSLLDAIGGTNVQQAELARTILEQVIGYSGLPPEVLAELMAGLGLSGKTPTAPPGGVGGNL